MGRQFLNSETFEELLRTQIDSVPIDIRPMIPGFLRRRENELVELMRLLESKNFVAIRYIGHKLKGTGRGFGLPVITDIGGALEEAALIEDPVQVSVVIHQLDDVTKRLRLNFRF